MIYSYLRTSMGSTFVARLVGWNVGGTVLCFTHRQVKGQFIVQVSITATNYRLQPSPECGQPSHVSPYDPAAAMVP
jgi:hypothetical protein